jgi:RND family efflux transporter MFP subunit
MRMRAKPDDHLTPNRDDRRRPSGPRRAARAGAVALFGFWALLAGCDRRQATPVKAAPPKVPAAVPVISRVTDFEEFTGRLSATESVDVRARVTGYLDQVNFKEGIRVDVNRSDLLFVIDRRPYEAEVKRADANVLQADARLKQAIADVKRNEPLVRSGAVTQQDLDKYLADRDAAAASLAAAKAALDAAKLNLEFCNVTAPLTGQISRKYVDRGNLIRADDTILTSIVSVDPIFAYFDVDERTLLRFRRLIAEGKIKSAREEKVPVDLALADEPGFEDEHGEPRHRGVLDFADNKVDPTTGTLTARGEFDNSKRLLSPGLFVRIRLPVGSPHDATLVAEQALLTDQGRKYVFVVAADDKKEQVAVRRYIRLGGPHDGLREVVGGLKADERVIVSGQQQVRDNAPVDPQPDDMRKYAGAAARLPVVQGPEARGQRSEVRGQRPVDRGQ